MFRNFKRKKDYDSLKNEEKTEVDLLKNKREYIEEQKMK